jgi:hypothetical protein
MKFLLENNNFSWLIYLVIFIISLVVNKLIYSKSNAGAIGIIGKPNITSLIFLLKVYLKNNKSTFFRFVIIYLLIFSIFYLLKFIF